MPQAAPPPVAHAGYDPPRAGSAGLTSVNWPPGCRCRAPTSKIENEKVTPTLWSLERVARALASRRPKFSTLRSRPGAAPIAALMDDVFVAQVAPFVSRLSPMQMASVLAQVHDMAARREQRGLQFSGVAVAKVVASTTAAFSGVMRRNFSTTTPCALQIANAVAGSPRLPRAERAESGRP